MTNSWSNIANTFNSFYIAIGTIITVGFSIYKWIKIKKHKQAKEIYILIEEWYDYIDVHLDDKNFNFNKLNSIENKIEWSFQKNGNLTLAFSKRFIKKSLLILGANLENQDERTAFEDYTGINSKFIKPLLEYI